MGNRFMSPLKLRYVPVKKKMSEIKPLYHACPSLIFVKRLSGEKKETTNKGTIYALTISM